MITLSALLLVLYCLVSGFVAGLLAEMHDRPSDRFGERIPREALVVWYFLKGLTWPWLSVRLVWRGLRLVRASVRSYWGWRRRERVPTARVVERD